MQGCHKKNFRVHAKFRNVATCELVSALSVIPVLGPASFITMLLLVREWIWDILGRRLA